MVKNISTKKRLILNLVLTQIGFAIISIVAILSHSKIIAIVTVNVIFAIIITYFTISSMNRIIGGIDRLKKYIDDLMEFAFLEQIVLKKLNILKMMKLVLFYMN